MSELILEGGAAVNGRRILQSEVPTILDKVDEILSGLGLVRGEDWDMVGSAGKKKAEDTSGDIDICIKKDRMKEVLGSGDGRMDVYNDLGNHLEGLGYDRYTVQPGFSQVSFGMPMNDAEDIIQVDFMLVRNLEWSKFTQASPDYTKDESKYKGHVRNVLMMCIVKYCFKKTTKRVTLDDDSIVDGETENFVIRLTDGLYKTRKNWFGKKGDSMVKTANLMHEYDELITDTPQGLIDLLFNDGSIDDFLSFETLYDAFMSDRFKFPENRERILVGYVMSLDGQKIDIPTEVPQEYVDKAREKERLAKEREEFEKANKIKRKIKHIEIFESFDGRYEMKNIIPFDKFLTQYKSSCRNYTKAISLVEGAVLNTTNTPEDIEYVELNIYDDWIYVDGYIRKQGGGYSKHPLAIALYIPPTMWDSLGMTYDEWATQMLDDAEIRELKKSKINIDNPPSGFFELIGFEKNRNIMWLDIDGEEIPFTAYFHKQLFERGGELFRVPPTDRKAQEYVKVLRIGDFN